MKSNQKLKFKICCTNCQIELNLITTSRLKENGAEAYIKIEVEPCKECVPEDVYVDLFINEKKEDQFLLARP